MKQGRRADKEDRRSQKRKIREKRRETKKKQKRRTKKRRKLCSTSPPGGNQVDGLPPVPHPEKVNKVWEASKAAVTKRRGSLAELRML